MTEQKFIPCPMPATVSPAAAEALSLLRVRATLLGVNTTFDDHVGTADAAKLLNRTAKTLRNWRDQNTGPAYRTAPNGWCEYAMTGLAAWCVGEKKDL